MPNNPKKKRNVIAICYDFDGTLSPRNMQEDTIFKEYKIDAVEFWREVSRVTKSQGYDPALCYLNKLIFDPRFQKKPLTKKRLGVLARKVRYCPGVESYFSRISRFVKKETRAAGFSVELEHYIISSGLKSILDTMSLRKHFKAVYACEYDYGKNEAPIGVKSVVNDAIKTQCLFRISKGKLELHENVNERVEHGDFRIPFSQMIFIGDGETDIPSMAVVKKFGGHAVAVYPPGKQAKIKSLKLFNDGRADYVAAADYTEGSTLDKSIKTILRNIIRVLGASVGQKAVRSHLSRQERAGMCAP